MEICLIQVPYTCGDEHHGASKGADRYVQAGVEKVLAAQGAAVTVKRVERPAPFRDSASSSLADCRLLAQIVSEATAAGQFPLILAGSCDISKGILSGFDHAQCGIIWLDAHGDFNTPESTITGFFPGMSLAVVTGHCFRNYWAQLGNSTAVPEAATLLVGVRDLDPEERERLERSAIQVVSWRDGKPQTSVTAALDRLAERVHEVYLHVDMDVLSPEVAPGIVDHPVPGGLALRDMDEILRAMSSRFRIRAAALATYNPDLDKDDKTLGAGMHIIEQLASLLAVETHRDS